MAPLKHVGNVNKNALIKADRWKALDVKLGTTVAVLVSQTKMLIVIYQQKDNTHLLGSDGSSVYADKQITNLLEKHNHKITLL